MPISEIRVRTSRGERAPNLLALQTASGRRWQPGAGFFLALELGPWKVKNGCGRRSRRASPAPQARVGLTNWAC